MKCSYIKDDLEIVDIKYNLPAWKSGYFRYIVKITKLSITKNDTLFQTGVYPVVNKLRRANVPPRRQEWKLSVSAIVQHMNVRSY